MTIKAGQSAICIGPYGSPREIVTVERTDSEWAYLSNGLRVNLSTMLVDQNWRVEKQK